MEENFPSVHQTLGNQKENGKQVFFFLGGGGGLAQEPGQGRARTPTVLKTEVAVVEGVKKN